MADQPETKPRSRSLLILLLVLIAIGVAFLFIPHKWIENLRGYFEQAGWWGGLIFVVVYVITTVLLIPASAMTLLAGGVYGFLVGLLITIVASNLGALCSFLLGRSLLRARVEEWARERQRFASVREAIGQNGFKIVLLLRLSPIFPFTILNYLLGVTSISLPRYVVANVIGMLPGTIVFVYIGVISGNLAMGQQPQTLKLASQIVGLLATIAVTFYITRLAKRALNDASLSGAENESKSHGD
jgi:uncharacterized membrane protein YdjX (TVP38/TMEM64 family)